MDRIAQALKLAKEENTLELAHAKQVDNITLQATNTLIKPVRNIDVPDEYLRKKKVISSYWNEPIADAFRVLRTRVLQRMKQNGWNSIGITSVEPNAGKSLTAINLGIAMAKEPGMSVIIVDTDLRRPSTHEYFGIEPEEGIENFLLGDSSVDSLLFSPGIKDFLILPCAHSVQDGPEHLKSARMHELVTTLKRLYPHHIIIYDLPPILIGDDAMAFSTLVDTMLLVLEDGVTQDKALKEAKELLNDINLIGTVLNKVPEISSIYRDYY